MSAPRTGTRLSGPAEREIEALRRSRMTGPAIARGLGRLRALDPRPPVIRYERERPGELVHIDVQKLGRIDGVGHRVTGDRRGQSNRQSNRRAPGCGLGWEYLHVAVDDRSRLACTELLPSQGKDDASACLTRATAWFAAQGVTVERVMTDNGSAYRSKRFAAAPQQQGVTHKHTKPYTPRTNAKAERLIQSSIREWAYATPFQTSAERKAALHPWLHRYNTQRTQGRPRRTPTQQPTDRAQCPR